MLVPKLTPVSPVHSLTPQTTQPANTPSASQVCPCWAAGLLASVLVAVLGQPSQPLGGQRHQCSDVAYMEGGSWGGLSLSRRELIS